MTKMVVYYVQVESIFQTNEKWTKCEWQQKNPEEVN